ncbi:LacI family DNA-binding transcriptional regulator [Simiduia aestuariiviva]|uniref:LacI family transcriptional regulator n=1 Tax=Simiduia aestuariiviva TaxID=1510459 RepID=A0A839UL98_9GAMM|nr:LacI family DNA-binding transcriptional regulator [Simiduia aestuariiviva]MBB3167360.1 LacI family transcriptional regulator [Simiduia aestuariiviva]
MVTIYDVSERAGVSLATVSRVMNNNARVSDKTKAKVLQAMADLGYRPNAIAKGLASSRSNSVGVLISELHGPFYGMMMSAIETELRKHDIHSIFAAGHSDAAKEEDAVNFLLSRRCDALILYVEAVSDEFLVELNKRGTPIVVLGRDIKNLQPQCINLDNEQGGYLAAKYLLDAGHRDIAYISGPLWKVDTQDRLAGHRRALAEHQLTFDESLLIEGDFQEEGGVDGLNKLLSSGRPFTAVACGNDEMAAGAMAAARDAGMTLPDDLSIVGFDNVAYSRFVYPKLCTVNYPVREMAEMATHWVLRQVYDHTRFEIENTFTPVMVERNSVLRVQK